MVARVWCLGRVPKHRNQWQEVEGLLFSPQNIQLSNRSDSPRFRAPWKDTSKTRDTTGTVFIQGLSVVLLVWRSIMFNGSFLKVCRILRFVKKIIFSLLESGRTKPWCPSLVSRPSAKAQEPLARSRVQWQEVDGLLFCPKYSQLVHILSFHSQGVVS